MIIVARLHCRDLRLARSPGMESEVPVLVSTVVNVSFAVAYTVTDPPPSWAARQASQRCSSSPPSPPAPPDMAARARSSPGPPPRPSRAPVHWPSPSSGNQDCNQRLRPPYRGGQVAPAAWASGLRPDVPALAAAPAGHAQPRQDRRQIPGRPRPRPIRAQDDHVKVAEKTSVIAWRPCPGSAGHVWGASGRSI